MWRKLKVQSTSAKDIVGNIQAARTLVIHKVGVMQREQLGFVETTQPFGDISTNRYGHAAVSGINARPATAQEPTTSAMCTDTRSEGRRSSMYHVVGLNSGRPHHNSGAHHCSGHVDMIDINNIVGRCLSSGTPQKACVHDRLLYCVKVSPTELKGKRPIDHPTQGNPYNTLPPSRRRDLWGIGTVDGRTLTYPLRFNT